MLLKNRTQLITKIGYSDSKDQGEMDFNVGIYISENVVNHWGGGFSYQERLLASLSSINVCHINFFVIRIRSEKEIDVKFPIIELKKKSKPGFFFNKLRGFMNRLNADYEQYITTELRTRKIHLLFYLHPHQGLTNKFPYVLNNWDLAHITCAGFPDVLKDLRGRRNWVSEYVQGALHIFAESNSGRNEIVNYLQIPENRVSVVPMFSGSIVDINLPITDINRILNEVGVLNQDFIIYPAQFWALKNHSNLLLAFKEFVSTTQSKVKLILTGSDKDNLGYITDKIIELGIMDSVICLGYVTNSTLYCLYKKAIALVFPTLLGPTNMPILEAMELDCPVLCSDLEGHKEMLPGYSGFFDALDPLSISSQFKRILDITYRAQLIEELQRIRNESPFRLKNSINELLKALDYARRKRLCWKLE